MALGQKAPYLSKKQKQKQSISVLYTQEYRL